MWGWATGSACSSARYGIGAGGCWRKTCLATAVVSDPFPPQRRLSRRLFPSLDVGEAWMAIASVAFV